ncbi:preprotein translocase [Bacillus mobilis]|uniref:preprotein translocase n=1 Tax=Bacillus mobilis TaxID=2026190 RepID=UPI002E227445|nr:preprotein translocase [Bacillus mobilis]
MGSYYHSSNSNKKCSCNSSSSSYKKCSGDRSHKKSCPAYGTFWQTEFITVPFGDPFPFNHVGPIAGGVSLLNPTTIQFSQAGDYRVSFISSINTTVNPVFPHIPVMTIFLNDNPLANSQGDFAFQMNTSSNNECLQLAGETIITVTANSTLQLKNNSDFNRQSIATCDNGINSVELTVIKLS